MTRITLVLLLCMVFSIARADFQTGLSAYEKGDYGVALKIWQPLAKLGDVQAQNKLGIMHDLGLGVPLNNEKAMKWFGRAAEMGFAEAKRRLALKYKFKAEWYQHDDDASKFEMRGKENWITQFHIEAVKWFQKAASQGDSIAQLNLGIMYQEGKGIEKSLPDAVTWFQKAAAQGSEGAKERLAELKGEKYTSRPFEELFGEESKINKAIVTCKTRCINRDCYRTYSDGRTVHFQAQMKLNPFTNQVEFDSGGC